jgi:hypothetical protein
LLVKGGSPGDYANAILLVDNWRVSHAYPMRVFQKTLRYRARQTYAHANVVRRLKRFASIEAKLQNIPGMQLSRMQDIGGCRAIVSNVALVDRLARKYKETGYHEFVREFDYLRNPKSSGYRGIHLVYRYRARDDNTRAWDRLSVEIQLRSNLQHAWATAVEAVDTFTGQALKAGHGEPRWDRFFALMGTALARREKTESIPNTPQRVASLRQELRALDAELNAVESLRAYRTAIRVTGGQPMATAHADLWLLQLDFEAHQFTAWPYRSDQMEEATTHLSELEGQVRGDLTKNVVLVGADSLDAVRRAYPNYLLDTQFFVEEVERALGRHR